MLHQSAAPAPPLGIACAVAPESQTVHGETEAMPILRLLITATILAGAVGQNLATAAGPLGGRVIVGGVAAGATGGEFVVDSKVISDQAVGGPAAVGATTGTYVGDLSGTAVVDGSMVGGAVAGIPRTYGYPDLFYNNYTQGNANLTNAQMYVSPVPVPPFVGHTFITYQPFMPEEMLYWHTNRYHNYYDGGRGMNHTRVHYYAPPVRTGVSNLYWNYLRIPR